MHTTGRTLIDGVSEQGVEKNVWTLRGRKWLEFEEDCIMRSFITLTFHQMLL
jgi:hypothetical protein